jgi:hypothetical protein
LTTPPHTHGCRLCSASIPCESDCDHEPARLRWCPACEAAIDAVDGASLVQWTDGLDCVELAVTLRRATIRAVQQSRKGGDVFADFCADVEVLSPADATLVDAGTWMRIGAVQGARDAWLGREPRAVPDVPKHDDGTVARCYSLGWGFASQVVSWTRMEMMNNG